MKHLKFFYVSLLVLFLTAGCAALSNTSRKTSPPLPPGTLNAQEVTALFSDRTAESILYSNNRVSLTYYNPNGNVRQLQKGLKRDGVWRVRGDGRICLQFGPEREQCRIIVKEGEKYVKYIVKKDGRHERVLAYTSFIQGNAVD